MKLPKINSVSWKNTNHYEIFADNDPFWLRLPDLTDEDFNSETETGKRLGLLLDVFADYQRLQEENERLKEAINYIFSKEGEIDELIVILDNIVEILNEKKDD